MRDARPAGRWLALNRAAFDRWEPFSHSRAGSIAMFLWAVAEATFWPIVPDALLIPLAAGAHRRYGRVLAATVLGMALGGIGIYLFAFYAPQTAEGLLPRLPVIQPFMLTAANLALDQQGAFAFVTQPWSGVSFKVYAILGGARGLNPLLVIPLFIAGRALRMLVDSALTAWLVSHFPQVFRDYWLAWVLIYLVALGAIWVKTQLLG